VTAASCRLCGGALRLALDLGMSPPSNAFVDSKVKKDEQFFPLRLHVCRECWLVQLEQFQSAREIFADDYAYFSSYSTSWLAHVERFAGDAVKRFGLTAESRIVEVASNDGYLLECFARRGLDVVGIEPARDVATAAIAKGIPTCVAFLGAETGRSLAASGCAADLLIANNVLAHVPDLNDFAAGLRELLKPGGTLTLEFPHVLQLLARGEIDTIYHEHFSYFSLATASLVFERHGMSVVDVEELPTHGGSLRLYVRHAGEAKSGPDVARVRAMEDAAGLRTWQPYADLAKMAEEVKRGLNEFLLGVKARGESVAGYGAPAKATTLLNYCGVRADLLPYTVDRNPHKQGRLIPGVRIPIDSPERIMNARPKYVLILPWNIKDEVMEQLAGIRAWNGRFVTPIPRLTVQP
jgi:2-polyprenyl-3-methyl-5-hydroxy-6-metoxy-1,4-benzoquinol methylase